MSWDKVNETHRTRVGIYYRHGRPISLLTDFGQINPCYPDTQDASGDCVLYTGAGRRGDQTLTPANRALFDAIKTAHHVPLFLKLAPGKWQHTGYWQVRDASHRFSEEQGRMLWQFTLVRIKSE